MRYDPKRGADPNRRRPVDPLGPGAPTPWVWAVPPEEEVG